MTYWGAPRREGDTTPASPGRDVSPSHPVARLVAEGIALAFVVWFLLTLVLLTVGEVAW